MNKELVKRLVLYLVDQLRDMEAPVSTIRLVKYLYLIDLECFRRNYQTLTGIDWIRYKYGPYFLGWGDVVKATGLDLEVEEVLTEHGTLMSHGTGKTYRTYAEQKIDDIVDFSTEQLVRRILKEWCLADRDVLLEHVYSTMPVKNAQYGKQLDFTYETDVLAANEAFDEIQRTGEFLTIEELFAEFNDPNNNEA